MGNFAYIDNQNLYMATHCAEDQWDVDMRRFRVYLKEKYNVTKAYLFMGAYEEDKQHIYDKFESFGYSIMWRPHSETATGKKKGNVDTDIVFEMMKDAYEDSTCELSILVSGDGDYFRTVEHLISKGKFLKIMFPSHSNASSLYKRLAGHNKQYLDEEWVKKKIEKRLRGST